jgi:hypothetical protein
MEIYPFVNQLCCIERRGSRLCQGDELGQQLLA